MILILDRVSKFLVLGLEENVKIFPFLEIVLVKNEGIVFGLFSNSNLGSGIFIIISIISVIILTLMFFYMFPNKTLAPVFSVIIGGAVGNIIDRIFYGYVIDFIKVDSFYVFNIADASITIGSIILIIYILLYGKEYRSI